MRRFTESAGVALVCALLAAGAAEAHTQLSSSVPPDQSTLDAAPDHIALTFSEDVRLTAVALRSATGRDELDIELGDPATEFTVALPPLDDGDYVIEWRALSADTHVISGEIRFKLSR